jgi:hypothetical protein
MNQASEGARRALASFEEATQKDPNFALAYAGLPDVHFGIAFIGLSKPAEHINKSKNAAAKALELDDSR